MMEYTTPTTKFEELLASRGVSRRGFLQLCGAVAAAAGVGSQLTVPQVAQALESSVIGATEGNLYPVIWIEGASCTGCTEAFAQIDEPDPATVVLEMISCNYNETLSAAAGHSMEEAKAQTIAAGNYILVYEGALLEGWDGYALRVAEEPGIHAFAEAAEHANAVVALGSCAVNGGWMGATPNMSGAIGCQAYLQKVGIDTPVINIPGCPANPEWLVAVLVDVVLLQVLPELNSDNKPALIFNETVHDNCQRRGHFENGEFVYHFGSEEEKKGYCLYPLGCRGPQTKANCGVVRYNRRRSWCVESGAPCIGCCEADPTNPAHNWVELNTPFYQRHRDLRIGNWVIQPSKIAAALTALVAGVFVVHGIGMKVSGRSQGKLRFEEKRAYDIKHPDSTIGDYNAERTIINEDGTITTLSAEEFEAKQEHDFQEIVAKISGKASEALADAGKAGAAVGASEAAVEASEAAVEVSEAAVEVSEAAVEASEAAARDAADDAVEIVEETVEETIDAVEEEIDDTKGGQE